VTKPVCLTDSLDIKPTKWVDVDEKRAFEIAKWKSSQNWSGKRIEHPTDSQLNCDIKGVTGELAFERLSGLPFGFIGRDEEGRDRGDFEFSYTIDIKTSKTASLSKGLLVKAKRIGDPIDLYVLAEFQPGRARFWGWQWRIIVRRAKVVEYIFGPSHQVPVDDLRDMNILLEKIREWSP
jgi:hypothetical protein